MALIGQWVFVPLAVLLLLLAFWEPGAQTRAGLQGDSKAGKAADAFGAGLLGGVCADSGGQAFGFAVTDLRNCRLA